MKDHFKIITRIVKIIIVINGSQLYTVPLMLFLSNCSVIVAVFVWFSEIWKNKPNILIPYDANVTFFISDLFYYNVQLFIIKWNQQPRGKGDWFCSHERNQNAISNDARYFWGTRERHRAKLIKVKCNTIHGTRSSQAAKHNALSISFIQLNQFSLIETIA